jgi:hypothetical protein
MANPAMWAWEMMQKGAQSATDLAGKAVDSATRAVESAAKAKPKAKPKRGR